MGMAHLTGRLRCPRDGTMTKIPRAFNGGRLAGVGRQDYFARTGTLQAPRQTARPSKPCATLELSRRLRMHGHRALFFSLLHRIPAVAAVAACVGVIAHAPS